MRRIEQAVDEAVFDHRRVVAQHARQLPHYRIHQRHRRQFAAGQHEIAKADFFIDDPVEQALVDRFVASAQQHQTRLVLQLHHPLMVQRPALRRHEHHPRRGKPQAHLALTGGFDRRFQRLGQHHHAGTAAVRAVVHGAVLVGREIARIPQRQAPAPLLEAAAGHARLRQRGKHFGKQADDVKLHRALSHARAVSPAP